jgi:hypothetical protein
MRRGHHGSIAPRGAAKVKRKHKALPPKSKRKHGATPQGDPHKGKRAEAMPQQYERKVNVLPKGSPNEGKVEPDRSLQELLRDKTTH